MAAVAVQVPDLEHLRVNYRTHSGIMNVRLSIPPRLQCRPSVGPSRAKH